MSSELLVFLAFLYAGLLFFVAWQAERIATFPRWLQSVTYALSLAVYCSSWTFFGAVGIAANKGWNYFPIYLGPILLFVFGWHFVRRLMVISARNKVTSIADFIGSRYGKRQSLAAVVTLVAVIGSLPYIALQLKAVALAWSTVNTDAGLVPIVSETSSLVSAMVMALFAIAFGTRVIDGPHRHRGMIGAIAFESLVKLFAFVAVAVFSFSLLRNQGQLELLLIQPFKLTPAVDIEFVTQTALAMMAIVCLPRQFHVMVVEHHTRQDVRTARWLFPLYLLAFSLLVIPIAVAGSLQLSGSGFSTDAFVLMLPAVNQQDSLAALAFIGGLSAATGMVIVATVTLSIMISNELVVPLWLQLGERLGSARADLGDRLRFVRRIAIFVVLIMAWLLERALEQGSALASLGLISFAAAAQLMPSLVAALYWERGHRNGVLLGLVAGIGLWFYCLLLPAILGSDHSLIVNGPAGLAWLSPVNLFYSGWVGSLTHGVFWSLAVNCLVFWGISRKSRFSALDLRQAFAFTQVRRKYRIQAQDFEPTDIEIRQLQSLMSPLVGGYRSDVLWQEFERRLGHRLLPHDRAPKFIVREVESALTAIIGAVSSHRALELLRRQAPLQVEDFVSLVGVTSRQIQFSQELLQTTLETIPQGISVVDGNMCLAAWNSRYEQLFAYPPRLLYVGCPIANVYEFNASRGFLGSEDQDVDKVVEKRLQMLEAGNAYRIERRLPNETVVEIRGTPMQGGYVTTYTDITEYQRVVDELAGAKTLLEERVESRTAALSSANKSLLQENQLRARIEQELGQVHASKSRFLAAAGHDLLQPINAARLFVGVLQQKSITDSQENIGEDIAYIDSALAGAENLIDSLREISRLDSGKLEAKKEYFPISELLEVLANEFTVLAQGRGLEFRWVNSGEWIYSDKNLLRRVVQNFLSNAIRYTREGRVLLGCRRQGEQLLIEVWDSGPGIAEEDRQRIFEEFSRLAETLVGTGQQSQKGLGLGLSIAQRMTGLLGHSLSLDSNLGKGSVFRVAVPLAEKGTAITADETKVEVADLVGVSVLCIDNEPSILAGMQALLEQWGCRVIGVASLGEAIKRWPADAPPQLVLADYHLDIENGLDVLAALQLHWCCKLSAVVISADNTDHLRQAVSDGGYHYLSKPVQPAALRSVVRSILRRTAN